MIRKKQLFAAFAALVFVFWFTGSASGAAGSRLFDVSTGSSGILWQPGVSNYARITLTVSCPAGTVFRKTFASGAAPYFDLSDNGGKLGDGSYTYELRMTRHVGKKSVGSRWDAGNQPGNSLKPLVQSGYFSVRGGSIVTAAFPEGNPPDTPQDVVYDDDLIVQRSLCVGLDCANGENFGYDTIRLKENNLRIAFIDTTVHESLYDNHTKNDWQIRINESPEEGANAFFIDDLGTEAGVSASTTPFTIEAGATDGAFYIATNNRIGLGTSTPAVHLHLVDGNAPTIRLEKTEGTAQTWDMGNSNSGFFVEDAINSTQPFIIEKSAPSNALYITSSGNIGMGTTSPETTLELELTGVNSVFQITRTDGAKCKIAAGENGAQFGSATNHKVHFMVNNGDKVLTCDTDCQVGICNSAPEYPLHIGNGAYCSSGGIWTDASSREYKENISDLTADEAMAALTGLSPVKYNYKVDSEEKHVGFIAEDVPDLVATKNRKGMSPMDVVAVLTKVTQEQQRMLRQQQVMLQQQQVTILELKTKFAQLKEK